MSKSSSLYEALRKRKHLKRAWQQIRSNAFAKGASRTTRGLAQKFSDTEDRGLERVQEALRRKDFVFAAARGVAIEKPGKTSKRPLMVFDIESRIVQRALLDIVKEIAPIKSTLQSGFNFGGIEGDRFGVPAAIDEVVKASLTFSYFIRSDIKSFFDKVVRDDAISSLTEHIDDQDLINILKKATSIELSNRDALGPDIKYFPSTDHGLAQGSCLSPLLCNLVLSDFDTRMNSHGVRCIRYVDDFVIFAADRQRARRAFMIGQGILEKINLTAYDPQNNPDKAEEGKNSEPLTFLGCEITRTIVKPTIENRRKLLAKIDKIINMRGSSLTQILSDVSRTVQGWGNTFGFCTDEEAFSNLDREIHKRLQRFIHEYIGRTKNLDSVDWLASVGVQPLKDRKRREST